MCSHQHPWECLPQSQQRCRIEPINEVRCVFLACRSIVVKLRIGTVFRADFHKFITSSRCGQIQGPSTEATRLVFDTSGILLLKKRKASKRTSLSTPPAHEKRSFLLPIAIPWKESFHVFAGHGPGSVYHLKCNKRIRQALPIPQDLSGAAAWLPRNRFCT